MENKPFFIKNNKNIESKENLSCSMFKDYLQKKCNSYDKNKEVINQCDLCNRLMLLHCYNKSKL